MASFVTDQLQKKLQQACARTAELREQVQRSEEDEQDCKHDLMQFELKLMLGLSKQPTYVLTDVKGGGMGHRSFSNELLVRSADGKYSCYPNPDKQHRYDPDECCKPASPCYNKDVVDFMVSLGSPVCVGRVRTPTIAALLSQQLKPVEWRWCADADFVDENCGSFRTYGAAISDQIEKAYQQAVLRGQSCWSTGTLGVALTATDAMYFRVEGYCKMYCHKQYDTRHYLPAAVQTRLLENGEPDWVVKENGKMLKQRLVVRFKC